MKSFNTIVLILAVTAFALLSAATFADEPVRVEEGTISDEGQIIILPNPDSQVGDATITNEPVNDRDVWNDDWNDIIDYDPNICIGIGLFDRDTAEMLLFLRGKIPVSLLRLVHGYFTWDEVEEIVANGY